MSSGVEDSETLDAEFPTATLADNRHHAARRHHPHRPAAGSPASAPTGTPPAAATRALVPHPEHPHHHVLIEPDEDRWRWRRHIRSDPRKLAVYRVVVGIAGLLLIGLGFVSGPLPGPGGIPLVLLGLAVWASEFEWAHRLMMWFRAQLHRFRGLRRSQQVACWAAFFLCCGALGYSYMLLAGIPGWVPVRVDVLLQRLPGI